MPDDDDPASASGAALELPRTPLDPSPDATLVARWRRLAGERPDHPAVTAAGRTLTRADVAAAAADRAARLRGAGIVPGDRVVFNAGSSLDLVLDHLGALAAGAIVVPTNPAYTRGELEHILGDAEPALAISDDADKRAWAEAAGVRAVATAGELEAPAEGDGGGPPWDGAADDPAMILYTSGTTGRPKGALLSHGNVRAGADALVQAWAWTAEDRLVLALPLFHMHGLGVGLHGTIAAGASLVLVPRFSPDAVIDAVRDERATLFFGVPTMYVRLAEAERASELGALRLCVSGSAPLATETFRRFQEAAGQVPLERYGMTETIMISSNPIDGERRPGTVGLPLPGVRVALDAVPEGEVLVAGPNVFGGYWRRPDTDGEAFTAGGLFRTGDIARLDDAGYLEIVGRSKELIISGGFNVYPREVEEALLACDGVVEAAAVGIPSQEWGETVAAFVVRDDPGLTAEQVLAVAAERLARFKQPRAIAFVDVLPRNAMGKIVRADLPLDALER